MVIHEAEKAGLNDTEIREILDSEKASVCSEYAASTIPSYRMRKQSAERAGL
jgi:hypothetical protein